MYNWVNVLKEKLIEILETMGYSAYLQGSMSEDDEYPESFFTFWNFLAQRKYGTITTKQLLYPMVFEFTSIV